MLKLIANEGTNKLYATKHDTLDPCIHDKTVTQNCLFLLLEANDTLLYLVGVLDYF